eukprot:CAMPEP_0114136034 /NCGR_PEP_ID=MMETSP0043_2-20121206/14997_1 /TAXON_ID=464988 /ORGANISM="Hemiselmis andersenii, Strain CCMP644" /LENGTH=330 /DNA_ID=CAMNT_0001229757 /DNA_START=161 /DNA_END=1153 /DNA_ORIENTATION=-
MIALQHSAEAFVPATAGTALRTVRSARCLATMPLARAGRVATALRMTEGTADSDKKEEQGSRPALTAEQLDKGPGIPNNEVEMITAAAEAAKFAREDGITRQKMRFLLPREGVLSPTDEDWPGGIMQLFFACSPITRAFLRRLSSTAGGVGAKCTEQRLDESGVDGVSLWTAQAEKASDDMFAFCQPNGEALDAVEQVCKSAGPRLVLLINPQWRETMDSYDELGNKDGLLGAFGRFLGGTTGDRKKVADLGFKDTYLIQEYVVRGDDCRIVKCYPYPDWYAYTTDDDEKLVCLGKQKTRPTYQDISDMFEEKGVAMKWAREAGIGKKFE